MRCVYQKDWKWDRLLRYDTISTKNQKERSWLKFVSFFAEKTCSIKCRFKEHIQSEWRWESSLCDCERDTFDLSRRVGFLPSLSPLSLSLYHFLSLSFFLSLSGVTGWSQMQIMTKLSHSLSHSPPAIILIGPKLVEMMKARIDRMMKCILTWIYFCDFKQFALCFCCEPIKLSVGVYPRENARIQLFPLIF